jgi:surface antigen
VTRVAPRDAAARRQCGFPQQDIRMVASSQRSLVAALALVLCATAVADPPKHAPAHGWRRKHDADYVGYSGAHWQQDYEVLSGRCNRQAVGAVVGAVVGGVAGARAAAPDNRAVATLIGAAVGALVGGKIGHELDEADRGCFGHSLEIGETGRRVIWTNETTHVRYELAPGEGRDRNGASCRAFTLVAIDGRDRSSRSGVACQIRPGEWQFAG